MDSAREKARKTKWHMEEDHRNRDDESMQDTCI